MLLSFTLFLSSLTHPETEKCKKMYKIKIQIPALYLHNMLAQQTLCTCEEKQVFVEKYFKLYDFVDVHECLKKIKLFSNIGAIIVQKLRVDIHKCISGRFFAATQH